MDFIGINDLIQIRQNIIAVDQEIEVPPKLVESINSQLIGAAQFGRTTVLLSYQQLSDDGLRRRVRTMLQQHGYQVSSADNVDWLTVYLDKVIYPSIPKSWYKRWWTKLWWPTKRER